MKLYNIGRDIYNWMHQKTRWLFTFFAYLPSLRELSRVVVHTEGIYIGNERSIVSARERERALSLVSKNEPWKRHSLMDSPFFSLQSRAPLFSSLPLTAVVELFSSLLLLLLLATLLSLSLSLSHGRFSITPSVIVDTDCLAIYIYIHTTAHRASTCFFFSSVRSPAIDRSPLAD